MKTSLAAALVAFTLLSGCVSRPLIDPNVRPQDVSKLFPAGTPMSEVLFRWRPTIPSMSMARPDRGWDSHWDSSLRNRINAAAVKIGAAIAHCERYTVRGSGYCWFYYDGSGKLLIAEFQPDPSSADVARRKDVRDGSRAVDPMVVLTCDSSLRGCRRLYHAAAISKESPTRRVVCRAAGRRPLLNKPTTEDGRAQRVAACGRFRLTRFVLAR
jgi:hypothetical protein